MFKLIIRHVFLRFSPELAHRLAVSYMKRLARNSVLFALYSAFRKRKRHSLERELFGLTFPNPLGLAAGFDNNGDCYNEMLDLGFGFVEIGSITPRPQAGNERVHDISEGIAIEMVVDRSGSMGQEMQYEGKEMTRLEVVKDVFQRFVYGDGKSLEGRPNDLIGIISFARYAETACPLTLSQKVLKTLVDKIDLARDQSEDGTAIGEALALGIARLHTADETLAKQLKKQKTDYHIKSKVIILLTDGENNVGRKVESVRQRHDGRPDALREEENTCPPAAIGHAGAGDAGVEDGRHVPDGDVR